MCVCACVVGRVGGGGGSSAFVTKSENCHARLHFDRPFTIAVHYSLPLVVLNGIASRPLEANIVFSFAGAFSSRFWFD